MYTGLERGSHMKLGHDKFENCLPLPVTPTTGEPVDDFRVLYLVEMLRTIYTEYSKIALHTQSLDSLSTAHFPAVTASLYSELLVVLH